MFLCLFLVASSSLTCLILKLPRLTSQIFSLFSIFCLVWCCCNLLEARCGGRKEMWSCPGMVWHFGLGCVCFSSSPVGWWCLCVNWKKRLNSVLLGSAAWKHGVLKWSWQNKANTAAKNYLKAPRMGSLTASEVWSLRCGIADGFLVLSIHFYVFWINKKILKCNNFQFLWEMLVIIIRFLLKYQ